MSAYAGVLRAAARLGAQVGPGVSPAPPDSPAAPVPFSQALRNASLAAGGVLVVGLGAIWFSSPHGARNDQETVTLEIPTGRPAFGPVNAQVQAVLFTDPSCLDCLRVQRELVPLLKRQVDRGRSVRLTVLQVPLLGSDSQEGALISECVWTHRPGAFLNTGTFLLDNAGPGDGWLTAQLQARAARQAGMRAAEMNRCVRDAETSARVAGDLDVYLKTKSTLMPALFMNGRPLDPTEAAVNRVLEAIIPTGRT